MRTALIFWLLCCIACQPQTEQVSTVAATSEPQKAAVTLIILGTVQDAGSPHIACTKDCCRNLFAQPDPDRKVVSLGVIDEEARQKWLFEATPDMPAQLKLLKAAGFPSEQEVPHGIFLTHAHIGHYTGLMYLGKEAMNAASVPVYAMPKMRSFLEENGPWSQLVATNNIVLQPLQQQQIVALSPNVSVQPFTVPHRDEYSETVGFTIIGPNSRVLFIPDIDKWSKWEQNIAATIANVDYAFVDGTFFDAAEINHRDISEIPHPFIIESMELLADLPKGEKEKVHFIHFNHTNPLLDSNSEQAKQVQAAGFKIARIHATFPL